MELLQNDRFRKGLSRKEKALKQQAAEAALPEVTRKGELSIRVKTKLDAADRFGYLYGAGMKLSSLLKHNGGDEDFLLITSFRGGISKKQNEGDFGAMLDRLHRRFDAQRTRAYWLIGHWTQCTGSLGGTEINDVLEYSWLFSKADKQIGPDEWLQAGIDLSKEFSQAVFIARVSGEITVRAADGSVGRLFFQAEEVEHAWQQEYKRRVMAEPYPPVEGSGVAFPPHVFLAVPHNISGKMMFSSRGIDYRVPGVAVPGDPTGKPTVWEPRA